MRGHVLTCLAFGWCSAQHGILLACRDSRAIARTAGFASRRRLPPRTNKERRMNKMDLIEHVAGEMEMSRAAANRAVDTIIEGITKALKKGEEVRITGFGTFTVKKRAAGKGRNPATGEAIKIPASKNARFKAGATLKAAVNKG